MDGTAVSAIAALEDKNKTIEIAGQTFARADFKRVMYNPRPQALEGKTLSGLIDYIKENREVIIPSVCMIRVVDHSEVKLVRAFDGEDLKRTEYYRATLDGELPVFPFDRYLDVEDFIIKARALFEPSEDLDAIVAIVSRVVAQDEITAKDNGLAQEVQVRRGVSGAMTDGVETKGMYELRPYRTFRDVRQPDSKFILRLKARDGSTPMVALFDAEGGIWRYKAMQTIKEFLVDQVGRDAGIPVLA